MKRYFAVLLIGLIITSCNYNSVDYEVYEQSQKILRKESATTINKIDVTETNEKDEEILKEACESCEFDIDIGDKVHRLRIVMEAKSFDIEDDEILYNSNLIITIYDIDDLTTPIQVLKNKTNGTLFFDNGIVDANFDGFNDFSYVAYRGASNFSSNFFLWNDEEMKFVFSEELSELSLPTIDEELKVIYEFNKSGALSNYTRLYRFIGNKLICFRAIHIYPSDKEGIGKFIVQELIEDELIEIISREITTENMEEIYDEYVLWMDLKYTGDSSEMSGV